jgi:hypothetical protein
VLFLKPRGILAIAFQSRSKARRSDARVEGC